MAGQDTLKGLQVKPLFLRENLYSIHTGLHVWTYSSMLRIPPSLVFFFCLCDSFKDRLLFSKLC